MEGHGIMKDHGRSAVSVKENNLIPLRATSIKDENAGSILILTSYEPRFRDTGINYENYEVIFIGKRIINSPEQIRTAVAGSRVPHD